MHSHGNRSAALFANIRRIKESAKERRKEEEYSHLAKTM
jgi:hypothetical protein